MSEPLASWQRWHMGDLSTPRRPAAANVAQRRERQQQAQLREKQESVRKQAWDEGLAAGKTAGHEQGYAQGLKEGRNAGRQEFDARREQLEQPLRELMHGLQRALEQLDADIGDTLTDVALAAARRLADDHLAAHPEQILTLIHRLLREEPLFSGQPRLWLHPDDIALLDEQITGEVQGAGWKLQPDDSLERGGCRVTGPEGELNATREARWQALLSRARRFGSAPIQRAAPPAAAEETP